LTGPAKRRPGLSKPLRHRLGNSPISKNNWGIAKNTLFFAYKQSGIKNTDASTFDARQRRLAP